MLTTDQRELRELILRGELDINNTESFFKNFYRALLYDLNRNIKVRGCYIPHIVLNTGDDTMFLEVKGEDHSIEPLDISNEDYVYNQVPRAMVQFNGINLQPDELTAPSSRGSFSYEYNDMVYGITAEFRRMPLITNVSVKYYFDNFSDVLECAQQCISNLSFVKNFSFTYLGQTIFATYKIPEAIENQIMLEFDGVTTDSKNRTIEMSLEVETNFPVFNSKTVIFEDSIIMKTKAIYNGNKIVPRTDEENQKIIDEA